MCAFTLAAADGWRRMRGVPAPCPVAMRRLPVSAMLGLICAGPAQADCADARSELLFEVISTPPLLVAEADASTIVQVDNNGCAVVHIPAHDRRRGDYRWRLPAEEYRALVARLEAARLDKADPLDAERQSPRPAASDAALVAVHDENLIELRIGPGLTGNKRERRLRLAHLRQDSARRPADSAVSALLELGTEAGRIADAAHALGANHTLRRRSE